MKFAHFNIQKSAILLANQIVYSGKSFVLAFLLARYFDKHSFGVYAFVIICLNSYLGFLNGLVYEPLAILKNKTSTSDADVVAYLYRRQHQLNLLALLVFGCLAFFRMVPQLSLVLIFLFLVGSQLHEFFKRIELNRFNTLEALYLDVVLAVIQFLLIGMFILTNRISLNTIFLSLALGCLPTIFYGMIRHREIFAFTQDLSNVFDPEYVKYVKPNLVFNIVTFLSTQLNNFVIFIFLGSVSLANCEAVRLVLVPLHITILAMGNILMPYFSRMVKVFEMKMVRIKVRKLLIFFAVVFAAMVGVIYAGGPVLLELFYKGKYANQWVLLGIYALIYMFDGMNSIITYYLKALGLINIGINIRILLVVINILVLIPLISMFREAGGLLATMLVGLCLFGSYYGTLLKKKLV